MGAWGPVLHCWLWRSIFYTLASLHSFMVASHRKVQFGWWSVVLWCNACKLCESTDPFSHFYCPCDTVLHDFRDMCFLFVVSLYHCLHIASCKNTSNDAKYRYFQAIKTGFYFQKIEEIIHLFKKKKSYLFLLWVKIINASSYLIHGLFLNKIK